jgi:hypothetical protein
MIGSGVAPQALGGADCSEDEPAKRVSSSGAQSSSPGPTIQRTASGATAAAAALPAEQQQQVAQLQELHGRLQVLQGPLRSCGLSGEQQLLAERCLLRPEGGSAAAGAAALLEALVGGGSSIGLVLAAAAEVAPLAAASPPAADGTDSVGSSSPAADGSSLAAAALEAVAAAAFAAIRRQLDGESSSSSSSAAAAAAAAAAAGAAAGAGTPGLQLLEAAVASLGVGLAGLGSSQQAAVEGMRAALWASLQQHVSQVPPASFGTPLVGQLLELQAGVAQQQVGDGRQGCCCGCGSAAGLLGCRAAGLPGPGRVAVHTACWLAGAPPPPPHPRP